MERLVTRIGNEPAVPTEFDMDFAFDLDKETCEKYCAWKTEQEAKK